MAKYKEKNVRGVSSNSFASIRIENYADAPAMVEAREVSRTVFDDGTKIEKEARVISFQFDPDFEFPVLNPVTREPTNKKATGANVYSLIQSYVLAKASEEPANGTEV